LAAFGEGVTSELPGFDTGKAVVEYMKTSQ